MTLTNPTGIGPAITRASRAFPQRLSGLVWGWSRALWVGVALCLWIAVFQPSSTTDLRLSDRILVGQAKDADPDYLLIEVTPNDLQKYGRPILSRENMTRLIEEVSAGEPERFLFDLHPGDSVQDPVQVKRAETLESFSEGQLGLVTALGAADLPHPRYAQAGTMLDGRLTSDADGWHRQLGRTGGTRGDNPALWLGTGKSDSITVPIDLRIAHDRFELVSASDVLEGRVDVTNRKVILSASPDVAPTRAYLPLSNSASRAKVIAAAAQSAEQGYIEQREQGRLYNLALTLAGAMLGFGCALYASSGRRLLLMSAAAVLAISLSHVSLAVRMGVPVTLAASIACYLIMINATLVQRFRIVPLLQNFMRGDLSPEEAWSWRAKEEAVQPAILLGTDGKIKRCNDAALEICDHFGNLLAAECLPKPGMRAGEIRLSDKGGSERIFELDWPYSNVPIATLRDVTTMRHQHETLLGQLYEDDLTGCLNRRGFDQELASMSRNHEDYQLFFIDLNGFKEVNDTHGHDAGDELLVACAQRLQNMVRNEDVVARLGGDEFAVLMRRPDDGFVADREVIRLASRITEPVRLTSTGGIVAVGAAIGHASPCEPNEDVSEVLRRADQAMYRHKAKTKQDSEAKAA